MRKNTDSRRRTTRSLTATIAALAAATMVLTGCGGPPSNTSDGNTEISWWAYGPDVSVVNQYVAAFNAEHPEITVNFKLISQDTYDAVLRPALASNSGPDVFTEDPGARFEQFQSYGIDLSSSFEEALGQDWSSQLAALGVDAFTKDGKLMAAPVGGDFAGTIWINKNLFDTHGLTPPTTFKEWVDVCAAFRDAGVGCFVHGAQQTDFDQDVFQAIADTIQPGLYSKAVEGEASWDDPKLVQAFQVWNDMFHNGIMQDGALGITQFPDANNEFLSGKYAMVMMGTWYMQNTRSDILSAGMSAAGNTGDPFVAVPIQFPAAIEGGSLGKLFGNSGGGLAVNAKSSQKDAATTFATWIATSKAGQQVIADLMVNTPSLAGIQPDFDSLGLVDPEVQKSKIEWMIGESQVTTETRKLESPDLEQALGSALTKIAAGDASPQAAAVALEQAAAALR